MFSNNEEKAAGPYWYWRQQPTGPDTNFSSRTSCYIQKVSNHEGTMAALFTILVIGDVVQDEVPQLALANRLPLGPVVFSRTFFFFFLLQKTFIRAGDRSRFGLKPQPSKGSYLA